MAASFPAQASSIGYSKQNTSIRSLYQLIRSGAFPPAAPGAGFPGADAQEDLEIVSLPLNIPSEKSLARRAAELRREPGV